ncbi:hybrid sensor histidine kinase/response regulator [Pedobacter duraquae]|uniref:histidine kinase n=1 Tax=Pedobacter duraquae TaxID=425511 RepID=A0A4R6IPQ1_9SPHI|nr:ATP-binding protein [Pedobacter duraquae]TDO24279.1 PAS domain S-box-containing protein [Pedobacter duraquae]
MSITLRILILEDNENDADLISRELRKSDLIFTAKIVQSRAEYQQALDDFSPDLILSDFALPAFDAGTAFKIAQNKHAHIPFIIVSGTIGEENAVKLIKEGVIDYVSKQKLFTLSPKIERALKDVKERTEKALIAATLTIQTADLQSANEDLLVLSQNLKVQQAALQKANEKLLEEEGKVKVANLALSALNKELEVRVANRTNALAESERRFRTMMETIPQIAWTNNMEGEILFYNQRWYDYTGLSDENHGASDAYGIIYRNDRKTFMARVKSIFDNGGEGEFQIRARRADGVYRWQLIRMIPVLGDDGHIQVWVGTATDIEELKQLQQHKDDFISIASHELKTPITTLKASLQLLDRLKDNLVSPMVPLLIGKANRNLEKVNTLIEDLLNATMANEGKLQIHKKMFNIRELIEESCDHVRSEGLYKINTDGVRNREVFADAIKIEQIIVNFVNNAIKYAPKSLEIIIHTEEIDRQLKISVTDKGDGIPQNKLANLFDRYYRVNAGETQYNGLGLGLYISAEIIKQHHGTIGVDSELDTGSTFWFTIPL